MKRVILLYLLLFPACFALLGAGGNSETEPNDTWQQADPIAINSYVTGSVGIDTDFEDWFVFTTPYYGNITFTGIPGSTLNINIDMFDSNGTTYIKGSSVVGGTGENNVLVFPNLKEGTYYLKVHRSGSTYGSYTIENIFEPTAIPYGNDDEPNDTWDQAQVISLNTPVTGNIGYYGNGHTDSDDWFVFTTSSYGQITFTAIPESTLNINIDMFDSNGTTFIRGSSVIGGTGEDNVLVFPNLKTGTYYLRTTRYSSTYGSYTIENVFEPTAIPAGNDEEPNDTYDQAQEIFMNTPVTGNIGYYGNGHTDINDWFVFTTPFDGQITFTAIPESTLNINIDMFDSNGTTFIRGSSVIGGTGENNVLVYPNLKEGTYYLRTTRYSSTYGSYTIENGFVPTAIPDGNDDEPNDTWDQAQEISLNTSVTGHIGFYGNGHTDINDWFSVQIDNPGEISIEAVPESTLDIVVTLYDVNGSTYLKGCDVCGGAGETTSLVYNISAPGKYFILLSRASSTYGSYTLNAFSDSGPVPVMAAFSAHVTSGDAPLTVVFADLSTGSPTEWEWSFGDGNSSALKNPEHTYTVAGTYTVQLTASREGSTDTEIKAGYIIVTAPVGEPGPGTGVIWEEDFEGSYILPDGWTVFDDDNDGNYWGISVSQNHTPGGGRSAYHFYSSGLQKGWLITPAIALPPGSTYSLSFWSYNTFPSDYGKNSLLISTESNTPGSDFVELWSPTSVSQSWVETIIDLAAFAGETIYLAFYYEGDFAHAWYLDDIKITGEEAADGVTASFSADVTAGEVPLTVTFTDSSTGNPTQWDWDFGDGGTSDKQNPAHTYTAGGTYTVALTASKSGSSNTKTSEGYIVVSESGTVPDGIADIDGNVYDTVRIGNQTWFASNLKVTRFNNGDEISIVEDGAGWGEVEPAYKWVYYNNDAANNDLYGKLYNGNVATDEKNVCPDGWRVATDNDWDVLIEYLGGTDVAVNKLMDTQAWANPNNATNESGFSALPGGYRSDWGNFLSLTYSANFYTSTTPQSWSTSYVTLNYDGTISMSTSLGGGAGRSIRCLKAATDPDPTDPDPTDPDPTDPDPTDPDPTDPDPTDPDPTDPDPTDPDPTDPDPTDPDPTDPDPTVVTDIDNNSYSTVQIGTQVWMAENLRVTRFNNGDEIPNVTVNSDWSNLLTAAWAWYDNDDNQDNIYGKLYNGYTVRDSRNICPAGWHVPTRAEWDALVEYAGGEEVAGGKLKAVEDGLWKSPNTGATDAYNFSAVPGGFRSFTGGFGYIKDYGDYWTSEGVDNLNSYFRRMSYINTKLTGGSQASVMGASVRCISDTPGEVTAPSVALEEIQHITQSTVNSGGQVQSDGGALVTSKGVVWSTSENPTVENNMGITVDGDGMGRFFSYVKGLAPGTQYYMRAYAVNSEHTGYSEQASFVSGDPGAGIVADIDGNEYMTVLIGTQVWMNRNLQTTRFANGEEISSSLDDTEWKDTRSGAYSVYPHADIASIATEQEMLDAYGALYNWHAAMDPRGLCPAGWKLPDDDDWAQLRDYLIDQPYHALNGAGNALKSCRQEASPLGGDCAVSLHPRWNAHDTHYGTDEVGFSALPAGERTSDGVYRNIGERARWWSATPYGSRAYHWTIHHDNSPVYTNRDYKEFGIPVRCIIDTDYQVTAPEVSTATVTDITSSTAVSGGNIISDGGASVTTRGLVWSTSENPTTDNNAGKTTDGNGTGEFTSSLSGLDANTLYYVRAYATNSEGTAYGEQVSFTTLVTGLELISGGKLSVFPNPLSYMAIIASEKGIERVVMHNLSGQSVLEKTGSGINQLTVNVEHLTKGVYLMTVIETGGRITVIKLVK